MRRMRNVYTRRWFSTFLGRIDAATVELEVAFVARQMPAPRFGKILDLCCGPGRHLWPLSERRYAVTGVDRDRDVLGRALARPASGMGERPQLIVGDLRALPVASGAFDGVINMWQSFGHYGAAENGAALAGIHRVLRIGGRLLLDLYNRRFAERHLGHREMQREGVRILEERTMVHDRLVVQLRYEPQSGPAETEEFEWQLFDPAQLAALATSVGFTVVACCSAFDESRPATDAEARMQLVLERRDATHLAADGTRPQLASYSWVRPGEGEDR